MAATEGPLREEGLQGPLLPRAQARPRGLLLAGYGVRGAGSESARGEVGGYLEEGAAPCRCLGIRRGGKGAHRFGAAVSGGCGGSRKAEDSLLRTARAGRLHVEEVLPGMDPTYTSLNSDRRVLMDELLVIPLQTQGTLQFPHLLLFL